jgi:hypothetical protein
MSVDSIVTTAATAWRRFVTVPGFGWSIGHLVGPIEALSDLQKNPVEILWFLTFHDIRNMSIFRPQDLVRNGGIVATLTNEAAQ